MTGVEQSSFNDEEFIDEVNMSAFNTDNISKTKKKLTDRKKSWRNLSKKI